MSVYGQGREKRTEESLERNRGKAENTAPRNSSFNIIFIDPFHVSQYRRHRILKSTRIHNGSCPPKATTCKITALGL